MYTVPKKLRARASEHSSNLREQFEQKDKFCELNGTIQYPFQFTTLPALPEPISHREDPG